MQKLAELEATAPKATKKKVLTEDSGTTPVTGKKSLKDVFSELHESVPVGAKPLPVLDPSNKQAGMGFVTSTNPSVQNMLKNLDPKDVQIVQAPGQQTATAAGKPAPAGSTLQPQVGQQVQEQDEDEDMDEGFFVCIGDEEDGGFVGMLTKEGGRWREVAISGTTPYKWGTGYMSYLTSDDIMQHIRNDFRHSDVAGPFSDEQDAIEYASRQYGLGQEQLDELSRKTLGSYVDKNTKASVAINKDLRNMYRKGISQGTSGSELLNDPEWQELENKSAKRSAGRNLANAKMRPPAVRVPATEAQLDELSPKTLQSYAKKADVDFHQTNNELKRRYHTGLDPDLMNQSNNRRQGMKLAGNKMMGRAKVPATGVSSRVPATEGAKVDRMVKHIEKSERDLGKSKEKASDIAWATANKRGMLDNKNKKKTNEDASPNQLNTYDIFYVSIPANVYTGKYYDYQYIQYVVYKGMGGVETEQDAIEWVNNNQDKVLDELDRRRTRSGMRSVRAVGKPASKNVFFKDKYRVRPGKATRGDSTPKANFDPSALQQTSEADIPSTRGLDTMGAGLGAGRSQITLESKSISAAAKKSEAQRQSLIKKAARELNFKTKPTTAEKLVKKYDLFASDAAAITKMAKELSKVQEGKEPQVEVVDNAFNRENYKELIGKKYPKSKAPSYARVKEVTESKKPDFLDLDKDGNKKEPMKKAVADKKKKKVDESMNHRISAARFEGKSHGLKGYPHCGKAYEDLEEMKAYCEGYKDGLDECYGQGVYETAPAMPPATLGGMASQAMPATMPAMEDEFGEGNAFTAALANTPKGGKFSLGGRSYTDRSSIDEYAFESWDNQLNDLLNEGLSVSISKGQQNSPDSVTITAQDQEAEHLLAFVKNAGLGLFGDDNADTHSSAMSVPSNDGAPGEVGAGSMDIDVVDGHDGMLGLMQKLSGIAPSGSEDYADEEDSESQEYLYGNNEDEESCNECGGMMEQDHSCGSKEMVEDDEDHDEWYDKDGNVDQNGAHDAAGHYHRDRDQVDEVESEDQMTDEMAEDNAPDTGEAESTADEDAEAKEDAALAGEKEEEMNESFVSMLARLDRLSESKDDEDEDDDDDEDEDDGSHKLLGVAGKAKKSFGKEVEESRDSRYPWLDHPDRPGAKKKKDDDGDKSSSNKKKVDEWANQAGKGPGKGTDASFEQDIEFMTKVIAGGLNKPKSTGQTTVPVIAGQDDRMHDNPKAWATLAGIKK